MFQQIRKRDGSLVDFDQTKITHAIERAARAALNMLRIEIEKDIR